MRFKITEVVSDIALAGQDFVPQYKYPAKIVSDPERA